MDLKEFCQKIGRSEKTILTSWNRTRENFAKKGIILIREGTGASAQYDIKYANDIDKE